MGYDYLGAIVIGCSRRATRPIPNVAPSPWFAQDYALEGAEQPPAVAFDHGFGGCGVKFISVPFAAKRRAPARGTRVRIHLPPAASQERTVAGGCRDRATNPGSGLSLLGFPDRRSAP